MHTLIYIYICTETHTRTEREIENNTRIYNDYCISYFRKRRLEIIVIENNQCAKRLLSSFRFMFQIKSILH